MSKYGQDLEALEATPAPAVQAARHAKIPVSLGAVRSEAFAQARARQAALHELIMREWIDEQCVFAQD